VYIIPQNYTLLQVQKSFIFCATSRTVPGSIPGGVTGDFFRGSPRRNRVPWGRLSPWKWVPRISPGVKAAGAYGWRPTTLVMPNAKKIRGLNLPETPWATSACCAIKKNTLNRELYDFWIVDWFQHFIIVFVF